MSYSSRTQVMTSSKPIVLALRSSHGRKRLEISPMASGKLLKIEIKKVMGIDEDFIVKKDDKGRPGQVINFPPGGTVKDMKLSNGDTLHILPRQGTRFEEVDEPQPSTSKAAYPQSVPTPTPSVASTQVKVIEDKVDQELSKQSGKISQPKSPNCRHTANAACIHCMPKEPYDSKYLEDQGIKFMSFHAYLRKLFDDKGKFAILEDINLKIKPGCTNHNPWPESLCSRCRPPALTLNRQTYRHVDNITFENANIVDNFLVFWRQTGRQRVGFLYGRYEVFPDVPLGIRAVVCAIYEPPQESSRDSLKLIPDEKSGKVDEIAVALGLVKIGWIFTDLVSDANGQVKHFRNVNTHFLSAQECIMAAHFQNEHPNVTSKSTSGKYGSKFVTVIVTGNTEKQVHMEGYQVSNQCMAMVRDKIIVPTKDAPELGYVIDSSAQQYVPDVIYKEKDDYGNEVTKISRPLPVEYLLIDVPVATPVQPMATFNISKNPFPIENRPMEGHLQDFAALANHRQTFDHAEVINFFNDFHLLIYLGTQDVSPLELKPLLDALRTNSVDKVFEWMATDTWVTLEALIQHHQDGYQ